MVLTEKERGIIKKIIDLIRIKDDRENKLAELSISLNFAEDDILHNLILDIIGFPQDNSLEFDFDVLNGKEPSGSNLRTDFDNMICRDWLDDIIFNYIRGEGECKTDDELINCLYDEYLSLDK